jgi:hypothetical protein
LVALATDRRLVDVSTPAACSREQPLFLEPAHHGKHGCISTLSPLARVHRVERVSHREGAAVPELTHHDGLEVTEWRRSGSVVAASPGRYRRATRRVATRSHDEPRPERKLRGGIAAFGAQDTVGARPGREAHGCRFYDLAAR